MVGYLILIAIFGLMIYLYHKFFKIPKTSTLCMFTGGVKAGKSTCAVYFAVKTWKQRCRAFKVSNFFRKLLRKELLEMPLLYSNIPLAVPYVPLSKALLLRKHRFVYHSVIYICEASLVSNSMSFSDGEQNERILMFYKLIGHELRGGNLFIDTQSISDLHYGVKRSVSTYFYIHHTRKMFLLPFLIAYIKESRYSEDNSTVNVESEDTEDYLKRVLIPKRVWKLFDAYCYSFLTDNLAVDDREIQADDLRAKKIVSFNKYDSLYKEVNKNDK